MAGGRASFLFRYSANAVKRGTSAAVPSVHGGVEGIALVLIYGECRTTRESEAFPSMHGGVEGLAAVPSVHGGEI